MAASLQQEFCALRDTYIEKQFGRLNDMQRQAVFTTDGPLLILAGAGSGKTTVLVNRIANLIRFGSAHGSSWTPREVTEDDVKALKTAIMTGTDAPAWLDGMLRQNAVRSWNVMAITFTNKAAGELKERLRRMLGGTVAKMEQLFSRSQSRSTNVATFLALLELVRGGRVTLGPKGELTMQRGRLPREKAKEEE